MDTVEELGGTYFYAGKPNLKASELLFMIFCENTASQFGMQDFGAVVAIISGRSNLLTRGKPIGATKGTSYASKAARSVFIPIWDVATYMVRRVYSMDGEKSDGA